MITKKVSEIINNYDLEGLLSIGAPKDEYITEIQAITAFIVNNYKRLNPIILADNIQFVFFNYFKTFYDFETCEKIATDIIISVKGGF